MTDTKLIAITGGIGAGKSVVSRILTAMGYDVYDCDWHARDIMDRSHEIHRRLLAEIHPCAVQEGKVCRDVISQVVFNDRLALQRLNAIVHAAVLDDLEQWRLDCGAAVAFVETAILYDCDLWRRVGDVWEVTAPEAVRVERVMSRNNLSRSEVESRIAAQRRDGATPLAHRLIVNDDVTPVLPRVNSLLRQTGA